RLREDIGFDVGPARLVLTVGLDAQQLLLVVPLVERLGFVEPLVALQPDQARARDPRDRLGKLGLPDAGRPFDQNRLLQTTGEEDDSADRGVGQILRLTQPRGDLVDRFEALCHLSALVRYRSRAGRAPALRSCSLPLARRLHGSLAAPPGYPAPLPLARESGL